MCLIEMSLIFMQMFIRVQQDFRYTSPGYVWQGCPLNVLCSFSTLLQNVSHQCHLAGTHPMEIIIPEI